MSVAEAAHRPAKTGRAVALWLAFLLIIAAAIALAWYGAGSLRPEVTASGLQLRTIKAGTGKFITADDAAMMDYVLQVGDQVVQTSEERGGPQPFTVNMTFPGFGEAMTHMQNGGIYSFTMPPRLAFGNQPPPQGFPSGNLTFQVRVRKVVPGGAQLVGTAPPQQQ